jgi:hypothetical protein
MIRSLDQQHKIDFYVSWTFVSVALLVFIFSLTFIYGIKKKNDSYVEQLEEQNYTLKSENIDLKHELRDTINYYRGNPYLNGQK